MITPGYSLTATASILPSMVLDFTTAATDARVVTTRLLNTATRFNSSGAIEIVNANLARYDFNPVTLICKGQLIEPSATNLFLNSLIDGTNLATQSVTLSATAYTMSFYGTGSVVISGGHSATVAGTGNFPVRTTYTFTPSAGSSTFTVSGDVKYAQIELGSIATSFIPTGASTATRNADAVSMTGTNFSSWYNSSASTLVARGFGQVTANAFTSLNDGTTANELIIGGVSSKGTAYALASLTTQIFSQPANVTANTSYSVAVAFASNNAITAVDATLGAPDTTVTVPAYDRMQIGYYRGGNTYLNGCVSRISYYPQRLLAAETQAISK